MRLEIRRLFGSTPARVACDAWSEEKHPRGQPKNAGQFGPGGGGWAARAKEKADTKKVETKPGSGVAASKSQTFMRYAKAISAAAPQGRAPSKKSQVEQVFSNRVSVKGGDFDDYAFPEDCDRIAEMWNKHVGVHPKKFVEMLAPTDNVRDVQFNIIREFMGPITGVQVTLKFGDENEDVAGSMIRNLNFKEKIATNEYLEMPESAQGKGLAKKILANQIEVYKQSGMKKVELHANIDVGGYAWAKYGFIPNQDSWDYLRGKIEEDISVGRGVLSDVSLETKKKIKDIIDCDDPRAIWLLSDLPDKTRGGKPVSKGLLLNSDWEGELRLDDAGAMERFNSYVGQKSKKA